MILFNACNSPQAFFPKVHPASKLTDIFPSQEANAFRKLHEKKKINLSLVFDGMYTV